MLFPKVDDRFYITLYMCDSNITFVFLGQTIYKALHKDPSVLQGSVSQLLNLGLYNRTHLVRL